MTDTSAKPTSPDQLPGVGADKPTEIAAAGWRQSEAEHQTARDTTKGSELPMGDRRAVMADTLSE